jgi:hypothetical protein
MDMLNIDHRGDRFRQVRSGGVRAGAAPSDRFTAIRFSCLVLSLLLPLNTFDQAHLLKQRPFRATDTVQSGGDHICDLRSDADGDGRPERLGDYVRICGTVIAEPSTYETGGWLFWIRDGACGMMIYGEEERLSLGDSVEVIGCLRRANGAYSFPETGLAMTGDLAIENMGVTRRGRGCDIEPVCIEARRFSAQPRLYAGNLVSVSGLRFIWAAPDSVGNLFIRAAADGDTITVYLDADTGIAPGPAPAGCWIVSGIAVRMKAPQAFGSRARWCIAPRSQNDLVAGDCGAATETTTWGRLKSATTNCRPGAGSMAP